MEDLYLDEMGSKVEGNKWWNDNKWIWHAPRSSFPFVLLKCMCFTANTKSKSHNRMLQSLACLPLLPTKVCLHGLLIVMDHALLHAWVADWAIFPYTNIRISNELLVVLVHCGILWSGYWTLCWVTLHFATHTFFSSSWQDLGWFPQVLLVRLFRFTTWALVGFWCGAWFSKLRAVGLFLWVALIY